MTTPAIIYVPLFWFDVLFLSCEYGNASKSCGLGLPQIVYLVVRLWSCVCKFCACAVGIYALNLDRLQIAH